MAWSHASNLWANGTQDFPGYPECFLGLIWDYRKKEPLDVWNGLEQ